MSKTEEMDDGRPMSEMAVYDPPDKSPLGFWSGFAVALYVGGFVFLLVSMWTLS